MGIPAASNFLANTATEAQFKQAFAEMLNSLVTTEQQATFAQNLASQLRSDFNSLTIPAAQANNWIANLILDSSGLTQQQINNAAKLANIDYDKVVTVGTTGADFTTLNAALTEMSKYKQVYLSSSQFSNFKAKILIKSGYVVAEQINIIGIDFSWLDIASEDAEVTVSRAALTQKVGRWYSFIRCKNGSIPTIKTLFTMDNTGTATERVHLYMINSKGFIESKMPESPTVLGGFKNAGERNVDLTQTSRLNCGNAIFTGAAGIGVRPATGSAIFMQYADVSNCGTGISCGTAAVVAAENLVATNCTYNAVNTQGGVTIDLTGANLSNAGAYGIYAATPCVVHAIGANLSNAGSSGVYASSGAVVNITDATVNNCLATGALRALYGGRIMGVNVTATGNKNALYASRGGKIELDGSTLTGNSVSAALATEGGTIWVTYSQCRNDATNTADSANDIRVLSGGIIYAQGSVGGTNQTADVVTATGIIYKGLKTKAKGAAAIPAGETSVTVTHTLATQPVVVAAPISTLGTATKWWISNLDATSFKLNIDQTTASAVTFHWIAELI